jgi:hypothetical protein
MEIMSRGLTPSAFRPLTRVASDAPFFLWPEDCEMWLKEWGSEGEYAIVRPWGGAEGGQIA